MTDSPLVQILMLGVSVYLIKLWFDDLRAQRLGTPNPRPLPGAVPTRSVAVLIAVIGALVLVAAETWGEMYLGIADEQTKMTALFALFTLAAAFIEEIIFRGFLVIENKGRLSLWAGIIGASAVFALLHPHLWQWEENFTLTLTLKGWFSTAALFIGSLWFYFVRFARFNPTQSLIPCFAAHAAKNLGVIAVKAAQGHLVGWW